MAIDEKGNDVAAVAGIEEFFVARAGGAEIMIEGDEDGLGAINFEEVDGVGGVVENQRLG